MPIQFHDSTAFGEVSTERTLTNIDRTRTDSVLEIVLIVIKEYKCPARIRTVIVFTIRMVHVKVLEFERFVISVFSF